MPIGDISRNANTRAVSAAVTLDINDYIVVADATSAGFTITLVDFEDGAEHEVLIQIDPDDSSGNTVTVSGNAGAFSASLASNGTTSAIFKTQYDGTWFVVGDVSSVSAGAASSQAVSAGLAASAATSAVASQSLLVSQAGSQNTSQSLNISSTGSTATSENASQSLVISLVSSVANSG